MNKLILKHPLTILSGVAIGVLIGLFNKQISAILNIENFAQVISFPGDLYLFFLQMTVIPIIISAIASSLGKLIRSKSSAGFIKRMVIVFVIFMTICAITGMALGMFGQPGSGLTENTRTLLGRLLSSSNADGTGDIMEIMLSSGHVTEAEKRPGISNFFSSLVHPNIFEALSLGSIMAIVFFSIIIGVAIGFLQEESALLLINLLSAIFYAFQKLISWSLYLLPFGLICLLAGQIAAVGVQIFAAMSKFIILYGAGTLIIFVICTVIIWIRSEFTNPIKLISMLFEPILLAFATRNSMATLPSAINCLDRGMKFNSTAVNLTLPLGMTLGRFGNIFYFALAVFFIAQIYGMTLMPIHFVLIFVGVIFAGTATAGASGIVTLSMLSIVLDPLNLPLEAVLIIFMAIDPIIDPFRTFLIVYVNMAAATLISKLEKKHGGGAVNDNQLIVFIQEIHNKPPLINRINGSLEGVEIAFIKEIGKRWKRNVVFKDGATMNPHEREWMKERADIIAGGINKDLIPIPPPDFYFSNSWVTVNINKVKTKLYFLLPQSKRSSQEIDKIINELNTENFYKFILASAKLKEYVGYQSEKQD
ncbi:MAG: dicarboxylate/amino acid:cation symporter [Treponema sp.]|nr:dicarboxylate/amino acid:cation symporter [Treponema sp.]